MTFEPLLGRHIAWRAHQVAGRSIARAAHDLGNAKVGEHGASTLGEEDVRGLDVAMDHTCLVGVMEPIQHVEQDTACVAEGHILVAGAAIAKACF